MVLLRLLAAGALISTSAEPLLPGAALDTPEFFAAGPCAAELAELRTRHAVLTIANLCLDNDICSEEEDDDEDAGGEGQGHRIVPLADAATKLEVLLAQQPRRVLHELRLGAMVDRHVIECEAHKPKSPLKRKDVCLFRRLIQRAFRTRYNSAMWRSESLYLDARKSSLYFGNPTLRVTSWEIDVSEKEEESDAQDEASPPNCPVLPPVARDSLLAPSHEQSHPQCPRLLFNSAALMRNLRPRIEAAKVTMATCPPGPPVDIDFAPAPPPWLLPTTSGPMRRMLREYNPQCEIPRNDERFLTFLNLLGQGKEAEVWRVCVWNPQEPAKAHLTAFKVFRRAFRGNKFMMPAGAKFSRSSYKVQVPPADSITWNKVVKSLVDAIEFSGLLPAKVAVLTTGIYDVGTDSLPHLTVERHEAVNRYIVYLGLGAAFPIASSDLQVFVTGQESELDMKQIREVAVALLAAVQACDRLGYTWMDLKPPNILLVDGKAKVGDIGFMRPVNEVGRLPGIGTAGYRPFEAFRPLPENAARTFVITQARAVFALGVTIYALVFGTLPWTEKQIKGLAKFATTLDDWHLDVENVADGEMPHELREVLEGMLHPNPKRRWTLEATAAHPFFDGAAAGWSS